jgi:hypothetical protein
MSQIVEQCHRRGMIPKKINPKTYVALMVESVNGYISMKKCRMSILSGALELPKQLDELVENILIIYFDGVWK